MRSFIRSHKKTNSLDESPTGFIPPSANGGLAAPEMPDYESLAFVESTPPHSGSYSQGIKHSPGFESFQKLNKKMFPAKLFKKGTSSNNQLTQPASLATKEYSSAPGTPQANSFEISRDGRTRNSNETKRFLAVKGTVTHSWGDNSGSEQQVIVLNSNSRADKPQSSTQPSTPVMTSDLGPAVRISSMRRGMQTTSNNSESNDVLSNASNENPLRQSDQHAHVYSELSKVKNKNRQARIHSHDDIFSLGQDSSVTMDFLKSTFSPASLDDDSLPLQSDATDLLSPSAVENNSNLSTIKRRARNGQDIPTINIQGIDSTDRHHSGAEDETSGYLTPDDEDEDDEDDDASSKFSFELNAINGRTSSVKYYSKPEPTEALYIDDLYEDEVFDEDMYCLEDEDDEMNFPSNDLNYDGISDVESVVVNEVSENTSRRNDPKPVKKYQDLFALSDEEEQDDDSNDSLSNTGTQETHDSRDTDGFQESDFDKDAEGDSNIVQMSNNALEKDFDRDFAHKPSADQNTDESVSFSPEILDVQPLGMDQASTKDSTGDDILRSTQNSKNNSQSPVAMHASSVPPVIRPSMPNHQIQIDVQPKNKVKSFADIFDLDEDSDGDEDQDAFIREAIESAQDNTSSPANLVGGNFEDFQSKNYLPIHASPLGRAKTPVQIYLTPAGNNLSTPATPHDDSNHLSTTTPSLPPPARSQSLKYHDLSSNLDSEIPGMMSNLYFIDEKEEDKYMEEHKLADDDYLDEINTVPEDFNFSDSEQDGRTKSSLRRSLKGSFRGTHSYSSQPTGTAKESAPSKNKLEIKNKTVTFFNNSWERSPVDRNLVSPKVNEQYLDPVDDYILSPTRADEENFVPLTPNNSIGKPSPNFANDKSLSPIQEGTSSVDNSPRVPLR